jgi:hypothetical protein
VDGWEVRELGSMMEIIVLRVVDSLSRERYVDLDRLRRSEYGLGRQRRSSRADYEIARVCEVVDACVGLSLGYVETVPEAGELQANVSLANVDKNAVDRSFLSRKQQC